MEKKGCHISVDARGILAGSRAGTTRAEEDFREAKHAKGLWDRSGGNRRNAKGHVMKEQVVNQPRQ